MPAKKDDKEAAAVLARRVENPPAFGYVDPGTVVRKLWRHDPPAITVWHVAVDRSSDPVATLEWRLESAPGEHLKEDVYLYLCIWSGYGKHAGEFAPLFAALDRPTRADPMLADVVKTLANCGYREEPRGTPM